MARRIRLQLEMIMSESICIIVPWVYGEHQLRVLKEETSGEESLNQLEPSKPIASSSVSPIPGKYRVMRRNGIVTSFDLNKIIVAMTKAFLSVEGDSAAASTRIHNEVQMLSERVDSTVKRRFPEGGVIHMEDIQDQVELAIMRAGYQDVARAYVL